MFIYLFVYLWTGKIYPVPGRLWTFKQESTNSLELSFCPAVRGAQSVEPYFLENF